MAKASGIERVAPRRFLGFFGLLVAGCALGQRWLDGPDALLAGFDVAAAGFLLSYVPTLDHQPAEMRSLAERSDANRGILLAITAVLMVVVFAAIGQLGLRDKVHLTAKLLLAGSLVMAWTFGNAVYALHYAHLFYSRTAEGADHGGLEFPGTAEPLMSDFAYFAFTLGVAVQTSDVQITSRRIRNVVTVHAVIGFFFNLGALALAINLLAAR